MTRRTATPRMLASDLDGTLIPSVRDDRQLEIIGEFCDAVEAQAMPLAYLTGRDLGLALRGLDKFGLPAPRYLVCDVGTSVYVRGPENGRYALDQTFRCTVREAMGGQDRASIMAALGEIPGLALQGEDKQGEFKLSFWTEDRYAPALREIVPERLGPLPVPPKIVWSHDPYSGQILLDLLPRGIAKHTALEHLRETCGYAKDEVVYAGDSGNDLDAILSGHPAVVVGNAPEDLKSELRDRARAEGIEDRVYFAEAAYAGGVLEGCRHFGLL